MNFKQLSYFVAIAEQRSFLKASQVLHISQPTVSAQIKLLEEELQVELLERRFDGTVLTPEGRDFLVHARTVLGALDAARNSMRVHQSEEVGRVSVGLPGSLTALLTVPLTEFVLREMPQVQLRVVSGLSGHIRRWLLEGEVDFGLVYGAGPVPELDLQPLLEEKLFVIARDANALRPHLNARGECEGLRLATLPLVLPAREHGLRAVIEEAVGRAGVPLKVIAEIDAPEQLKEMVRRTGCFTVGSVAAIRHDPHESSFATAPVVNPDIVRIVSLAHTSGRPLTRAARHRRASPEVAAGRRAVARLVEDGDGQRIQRLSAVEISA